VVDDTKRSKELGRENVIGMPSQELYAHHITVPRKTPDAQSVKECIAVYRRPKTMDKV